MKSFVKKVTVLAVAFSMASSTLANAQEEDGKVNFSVQGDLVSSYIWRGFYQTGASFQPTLSLDVTSIVFAETETAIPPTIYSIMAMLFFGLLSPGRSLLADCYLLWAYIIITVIMHIVWPMM